MTTYKGKNKLKSVIELAIERATYNSEVQDITDFNFAEKTLYGRVDRQHNPVIANEVFLKPLSHLNSKNSSPVILMNFVIDQFADFERHFSKGCRMGYASPDDPIFSAISVQNGYQSPMELYTNYYNNIMDLYVTDYLSTRKEQINNFEDFGNFFLSYIKQLSYTFPITLSGFQRSSHSTIMSSGFALDIGGLDFDDDEKKQNEVLNSKSYSFFKETAQKYGFLINKRNPGVLISDIQSPATISYLKKYAIYNTNSLFSTQYSKTLYHDIDALSNILLWSYNFFVEYNRIHKKTELKNDKLTFKSYKRKYINIKDIDYNYILYLYINIRNVEEETPYNMYEIKNMIDSSIRIRKKSHNMMLEYIDDQFKAKYNYKDGTLTYYKKKLKKTLDKSC